MIGGKEVEYKTLNYPDEEHNSNNWNAIAGIVNSCKLFSCIIIIRSTNNYE